MKPLTSFEVLVFAFRQRNAHLSCAELATLSHRYHSEEFLSINRKLFSRQLLRIVRLSYPLISKMDGVLEAFTSLLVKCTVLINIRFFRCGFMSDELLFTIAANAPSIVFSLDLEE